MEEGIKNEETQEVKEESEEVQDEKQDVTEEKPLDKMTVKELREVGKEIPELTGVHAMKKEELLAAIKKARGIEDEKPPAKKKKGKAAAKGKVDVKVLKEKIIQLKEAKAKARQDNAKAQVDILRRRINRLKKRTRKVA